MPIEAAEPEALSSSSASYHSVANPEPLEYATGPPDAPNSEEPEKEANLHNLENGRVYDEVATHIDPKWELRDTGCIPPCESQADQDRRPSSDSAKPFQRWIRTLQKRAARRRQIPGHDGSLPPWLLEDDGDQTLSRSHAHHRHSSSDSSFAFVTAVKSASVSLANVSILTHSRKTAIRSSRGQRTDRSSRASASFTRCSEESSCLERQTTVDPAVAERSLQRRLILEELTKTEEGYIGDLRFLMNVYVTILASLPTTPPGLRSSVNRNLTDIVELHDEILQELRRIIPHSSVTPDQVPSQHIQPNPPTRGHQRWRSLDAVRKSRDGAPRLLDLPGLATEPQVAAEVAKIFLKRVTRFSVYEEYGAKYELMIKDVDSANRMMPGWQSYQKGLEVLAASLDSAHGRSGRTRKSLTIADLLVKPIQRVCKYPLLFAELLKHTPVIDCPRSHSEIENALTRLREATAEVDRATNDSRTKSVLEKSWIIQDRLAFPDQLDSLSKSRIRSFGHIQLCGALHVCWQTKEGVDGRYMVALLYRKWLCLATVGKDERIYTIRACIALSDINVEEVDNGRGLQCHTAPHSWKIVFLCDQQLYELIMTACSPKEQLEWCARLKNGQPSLDSDGQNHMRPESFGFFALDTKTLGTVFRKPGTVARKSSIHRATTVGPKSALYQVILKNTSAVRETSASQRSAQINRSQSLLTTNTRIPVLAPSRAERARLEALLADVWTRDVLPFPGITARSRSERHVRASASSMMRRFSGSITSSFARRSASLTILQQKARVGSGVAGETTATAAAAPPQRAKTCASIITGSPRIEKKKLDVQQRERCATPFARTQTPRPAMTEVGNETAVSAERVIPVRRRRTYPPCPTIIEGSGSRKGTSSSSRSRASSSGIQRSGGSSSSAGATRPDGYGREQQQQQREELASDGSDGGQQQQQPLVVEVEVEVEVEECLLSASGKLQTRAQQTTQIHQSLAANNKSSPPPPRSSKFADKLARAGVRHQEVVVQGIRNWFR